MAVRDLAGMTVVLADDVAFTRTTVAWWLRDLGDPTVIQAADGRQAFGILAKGVDLVSSDFNMPEMHGLQLLKAVRTGEQGVDRATHFALLTAYSDKSLVEVALALDINSFLVKPVSKKALESLVKQILFQKKTYRWLKSAAEYATINVDTAVESVQGGGSRKKAPKVFEDTANTPLLRETTVPVEEWGVASNVGNDDHDEQPASIDDVPDDAILTRDIVMPSGQLLMKAGTLLTPRVVALLIDLEYLRTPVGNVWITVLK